MVSYDAKFKKTAVHAIAETEEDQYDQINDFEAVSIKMNVVSM